jgi:tetratricopeptide (TPR) repeat protein
MELSEKMKEVQSQAVIWAYRAWHELLRQRSVFDTSIPSVQSATNSARYSLKLAKEQEHEGHPNARDFVRAHWLLGTAYRVAGQTDEAEHYLHEALERCRRINMVDHEADILIDLARLRAISGKTEEAQQLAEEALVITERSGYVLQGADAHLELAKLALARGDKPTALEHAQKARELATCDGPPDYTYKVAYDEAGALLEKLR